MGSRTFVTGDAAVLAELSKRVDAKLGLPKLGRDHKGNVVPAERGGVTQRAADVDTKDGVARYEIAPENGDAVESVKLDVAKVDPAKRTANDEAIARLSSAVASDVGTKVADASAQAEVKGR